MFEKKFHDIQCLFSAQFNLFRGKRLLVSQTLDTPRIQYITRFKTTISNNFTTTAPTNLTWKFLARSLRNFHLLLTENIQRSMSYFVEYLQNNMYKKTIVNFVEYIKSSLKNIQQNNIINIMNHLAMNGWLLSYPYILVMKFQPKLIIKISSTKEVICFQVLTFVYVMTRFYQ